MAWIVLAGFLGVAVVAWARSSARAFDAEAVERRKRQKQLSLETAEAALLARLRERQDGQ